MRRRLHKIPRPIHYLTLKELEEFGLIRKIGTTMSIKYDLTGKDADKNLNLQEHLTEKEIEDLNRLLKKIGITINIKYELTGGDVDKILNQYISII